MSTAPHLLAYILANMASDSRSSNSSMELTRPYKRLCENDLTCVQVWKFSSMTAAEGSIFIESFGAWLANYYHTARPGQVIQQRHCLMRLFPGLQSAHRACDSTPWSRGVHLNIRRLIVCMASAKLQSGASFCPWRWSPTWPMYCIRSDSVTQGRLQSYEEPRLLIRSSLTIAFSFLCVVVQRPCPQF